MKAVKETVRKYYKYSGTDIIESTSSDYDFYEDTTTYKLPKIDDKIYGVNL